MFFLLEPTLYDIYQPVFTSWFSTRYSHSDLTDRPQQLAATNIHNIWHGAKKKADASPSLNRNRNRPCSERT